MELTLALGAPAVVLAFAMFRPRGWPEAVAAVPVLLPLVAGLGPAAVLAVLIGVNVGPNLTYPGSLSNLLWRNVVQRENVPAGFLEFSRVGLVTVPATLVVAVLGLWAGIELVGI